MTGKVVDMTVLNTANFDCQIIDVKYSDYVDQDWFWDIVYFHIGGKKINVVLDSENMLVRPRMNHIHFNDGSMVLPDGLVVEVLIQSLGRKPFKCFVFEGHLVVINGGARWVLKEFGVADDVMAIKVIGVTSDYEIWGKARAMEVFDVAA